MNIAYKGSLFIWILSERSMCSMFFMLLFLSRQSSQQDTQQSENYYIYVYTCNQPFYALHSKKTALITSLSFTLSSPIFPLSQETPFADRYITEGTSEGVAARMCRIQYPVKEVFYVIKKATAFVLALFLILSALPAGMAGEVGVVSGEVDTAAGGVSAAANIVPAKDVGDFIGEWVLYSLIMEDGTVCAREDILKAMEADEVSIVITEEDLLFHAHGIDDIGPLKYEFIAENGSLKTDIEEQDGSVTLYLTDDGMLYYTEIRKGIKQGQTAYFMRKE